MWIQNLNCSRDNYNVHNVLYLILSVFIFIIYYKDIKRETNHVFWTKILKYMFAMSEDSQHTTK
jgi:hypothetical protein